MEKQSVKRGVARFALAVLLVVVSGGVSFADDLLDQVVGLKLGLAGYVIGSPLTAEQKAVLEKNPLPDAYEGTVKFRDEKADLNVVVDPESDRVLALYRQVKDAGREQLKALVAELMGGFGMPTTMAHDKILYWAFNKHGHVSEDDFTKAKKTGQTPELRIIATVKLNSDIKITPDDDKEDAGKEKVSPPESGDVYFIITSDPLVRRFMAGKE